MLPLVPQTWNTAKVGSYQPVIGCAPVLSPSITQMQDPIQLLGWAWAPWRPRNQKRSEERPVGSWNLALEASGPKVVRFI